MSWKAKLNPRRFPGMSGKMAAIVGYLTGEPATEPELVEMCITCDGAVLGRKAGDCGMNEFIGAESDLMRNWRNLLDCAGLDAEERVEAVSTFAAAVRKF